MANTIDETGKQYGRLTVIERAGSKRNLATWLCQCECGNIKIIAGRDLRRGVQSCGCLQKEKITEYNSNQKIIDLTGQTFGKLIVIERGENHGEQPTWICQCECGTISEVMGSNLRKENGTRSCGCVNSKGEERISNLLVENQIDFKKEYSFENCISDKGFRLRFDFAIFIDNELKYLIEFDGIQHTHPQSLFVKDDFHLRQVRDNIKNQYCLNNNIPLIRIPYNLIDKMIIDDLIVDKTKYLYKGKEL